MARFNLVPLVSAAFSTAAAAPAVQLWLRHRQSIDHPNARSSHTVPTLRGGGLACAIGLATGASTVRSATGGVSSSWIVASAALGIVGRVDDLVELSPLSRLGAQVAAGAMVGARSGGVLSAIFGAVTVPAVVNAFNFMDGINGISGGTAAAWGLCLASDDSLPTSSRAQGAVAAGMGLGFLPYNVPKATMFLGDVGSYLFGAGMAVTVIESAFRDGRPYFKGAVRASAPLMPYLADTGSTIVFRFLRGESITEAHRGHAYQRLTSTTGWPHWIVSGLVSMCALTCGVLVRYRAGTVATVPLITLYLTSPYLACFARRS